MSDEPLGIEGSTHWFDPTSGGIILNDSEVATPAVMASLESQAPEVAAIARWANTSVRGNGSRNSLFERDRYVTPDSIYDQFRTAYDAMQSDDVVAGVGEITENLALGWIGFDADEEDEADVFLQMAEDIDLDGRIREMWRDRFAISQGYVSVIWGQKTYKARGVTASGNKKRKEYKVICPVS